MNEFLHTLELVLIAGSYIVSAKLAKAIQDTAISIRTLISTWNSRAKELLKRQDSWVLARQEDQKFNDRKTQALNKRIVSLEDSFASLKSIMYHAEILDACPMHPNTSCRWRPGMLAHREPIIERNGV